MRARLTFLFAFLTLFSALVISPSFAAPTGSLANNIEELNGFALWQYKSAIRSALGEPSETREDASSTKETYFLSERGVMEFEYCNPFPHNVCSIQIQGSVPDMELFLGLKLGDSENRVQEVLGSPTSVENLHELQLRIFRYPPWNVTVAIDEYGHLFTILVDVTPDFRRLPKSEEAARDPWADFVLALRSNDPARILKMLRPDVEIYRDEDILHIKKRFSAFRQSPDGTFIQALLGPERSVLTQARIETPELDIRLTEEGNEKKGLGFVYKFKEGKILSEVVFSPFNGRFRIYEIAFKATNNNNLHPQVRAGTYKHSPRLFAENKKPSSNSNKTTLLEKMKSAYLQVQAQGAQLASVVPNCTNNGVEVPFFSRVGKFLFDDFTMLYGSFKNTHQSFLEKHEGAEAANVFTEQAVASRNASFQQMKNKFASTPLHRLPAACKNYKDQIIKGDWDFLPIVNEYAEALNEYGSKEDLKEAEFTLFEAKEVQKKLDEVKKAGAKFSPSEVSKEDLEILENVAKKSKTYGGAQDDQPPEIIRKEDAIQMFQMNLEMWNANVKMAAEGGKTTYFEKDLRINVEVEIEALRESDKDVYSLIYKHHSPAEHYTKILPTFSTPEEKPQALTITIVYPLSNPVSIHCTNKNRAEKFKSAVEKEMAPEFSVITSFKQTNEGCLLTFYIKEKKGASQFASPTESISSEEEINWLQTAQPGLAEVQYKLGVAYANGQGLKLDFVKAYMWSWLAGVNGNEEARYFLSQLASIMTPSQTDAAKRLAQEWETKYIVSSKVPMSRQSTWPKFGNPQDGEILGIHDIKKWLEFSKDRWEGFISDLPKVSFEGWLLEVRKNDPKNISLTATHLESGMGVLILPVYICTDNSPDMWIFNSFYNKGSLAGFGTEDLRKKTEQEAQKTMGQGYKISSEFLAGKVHDASGTKKKFSQEREALSIKIERFPQRCE